MTKVTAFIEKINTDGSVMSRKRGTILESEVTNNGGRAADTAKIKFTISDVCKQGDVVKYIQDITDVDHLIGIWNFYDSFRDEAGYDLDGTSVNDTSSKFINDLDGRVVNFPDNNADNNIIIPDNSIIDLSGQFDIYIRINPLNAPTLNSIIFSKTDGTTGIEIGITNQPDGNIYVIIYPGGGSETITGTVVLFDGNPHWLRVTRNANHDVNAYVDGVLDGTLANVTQDLTNTANLIFGTNYTNDVSGARYRGTIAQIRIYDSNLSDTQALDIIRALRQPETMKFAGTVWQGDDQTSDKTIQASGFDKLVSDIKSSPATQGNIFGDGTDTPNASTILSRLTAIYLPGFRYFDEGDLASAVSIYSAVENMLVNFYTLSLMFNDNFYINARKVIITEPRNINHTRFVFANGRGYKITQTGTDDTALINDLEITNAPFAVGGVQDFSGDGTVGQVITFSAPDIFYGVYVKVNTDIKYESLDFTIDYVNKTLTTLTAFTAAASNVHIKVITQNLSTSPIISDYKHGISINKDGSRSKAITLQHLSLQSDIDKFGNGYMTKYKTVDKRVTIESPIFVNWVRPNYQIQVKNPIIGLDIPKVIKAMTWRYPEFTTVIETGEYMFNDFDLSNAVVQKQNEQNLAVPRSLNVPTSGEGEYITWALHAGDYDTSSGSASDLCGNLIVADDGRMTFVATSPGNGTNFSLNIIGGTEYNHASANTTVIRNVNGQSLRGRYVIQIDDFNGIEIIKDGVSFVTLNVAVDTGLDITKIAIGISPSGQYIGVVQHAVGSTSIDAFIYVGA